MFTLEIEPVGPKLPPGGLRWHLALGPEGIELAGAEVALTVSARAGQVTLATRSRACTVRAPVLDVLTWLLDRIRTRRDAALPVGHGLVGFLGYEALEPGARPHPAPEAWFALPTRGFVRTGSGEDWLAVRARGGPDPEHLLDELQRLHPPVAPRVRPSEPIRAGQPLPKLPDIRSDLGRDGFEHAVRRALEYIAAGDAYQVNLSHRLSGSLRGSPYALFSTMRARHPTPHAAFLDTGEIQIVGNSPEQFLRRTGQRVSIRPIKGTRARGHDPAEDRALARDLEESPKDRAEHVMIVDLIRNDLGRVAATGTVEVPQHMRLESFPTLHHLVSTVEATVPAGVGSSELLAATHPGGSVTGAPKIRAMQIIRELEPTPRGPYTGAIGALESNGDVHLAVSIRTAVVRGTEVEYRCGGGIVADSDPTDEWHETMIKAEVFIAALAETTSGAGSAASESREEGHAWSGR